VKAPGTPTIMYFPLEGKERVLLSFSTQRLPGAAGIDEPTEIMMNWTNFCEKSEKCLLVFVASENENAGLLRYGSSRWWGGVYCPPGSLLNTS